jgi:hypothetical protein
MLSSTFTKSALEATQLPFQDMPRVLSCGVKRLRNEADHAYKCSAGLRYGGGIPPLPMSSKRVVSVSKGSSLTIAFTFVLYYTQNTVDYLCF